MKIISTFHDYYDVMRTNDTDKLHLYKRETETKPLSIDINLFKLEITKILKYNGRFNSSIEAQLNMFIIGFCGKLYYGSFFNNINESHIIHYGSKVYFENFIDNICISNNVKNPIIEKHRWGKDTFKETFSKNNTKLIVSLFEKYKVPTFIIKYTKDRRHKEIILNPCLKDFEFYKVIDPYTCYQEISMYVGNVLVEDPNKAWPIDDKLKVQSHGYDKFSFRKDKTIKI